MALTPTEEAQVASAGGGLLPVGTATGTAPWAQTFDRRLAVSAVFAPTSGTMTMTGIWLPAGKIVSGISFCSGSTAESGGSHLWYALYKSDLTFMAQSADAVGAAAFAANTLLREPLTAPVTLPYSGLYYLAFCCVGTIPTLLNVLAATVNATGNITGMTPIVAATSTASLNTGTAPAPAGTLTAIAQSLWACVD